MQVTLSVKSHSMSQRVERSKYKLSTYSKCLIWLFILESVFKVTDFKFNTLRIKNNL